MRDSLFHLKIEVISEEVSFFIQNLDITLHHTPYCLTAHTLVNIREKFRNSLYFWFHNLVKYRVESRFVELRDKVSDYLLPELLILNEPIHDLPNSELDRVCRVAHIVDDHI